jgi:hypothetical protein
LKARKKSKKWRVRPIIALLVFLITILSSRFHSFIEKWYSQKFYVGIADVISSISSKIPFSLDDLFYMILFVSIIILLIITILKKISISKFLKIVLNILASVYILFYALWGFNYFRTNLNERLGIEKQTPNTNLFTNELKKLISDTNTSYSTFNNVNKLQIDSMIEDSYKNLAPALKIKYPQGKRKPKKITYSRFFAQAGISGYYGPFFSEVHVNKFVLPVEYPFVLAHEKAHQFGITSEAEANFYAWLVCSNSLSVQLRYSANLMVLRFFLFQGTELENYQEIVQELNANVKADYQKIRENWQRLRNEKVDKIATKVNDTYLKTNKVKKGIDDYNDVVQLVMDFVTDTAFQKQYELILH